LVAVQRQRGPFSGTTDNLTSILKEYSNYPLLAGGGMKTGQVIGATDRLGGEPNERPVTFGEVFATLYHSPGIDVKQGHCQIALCACR